MRGVVGPAGAVVGFSARSPRWGSAFSAGEVASPDRAPAPQHPQESPTRPRIENPQRRSACIPASGGTHDGPQPLVKARVLVDIHEADAVIATVNHEGGEAVVRGRLALLRRNAPPRGRLLEAKAKDHDIVGVRRDRARFDENPAHTDVSSREAAHEQFVDPDLNGYRERVARIAAMLHDPEPFGHPHESPRRRVIPPRSG